MTKPFPQSYWFREGLLCGGCYPGDTNPTARDGKLNGLLDCGIRVVLSLMEATEKSRDGRPFVPYAPRLRELAAGRELTVECLSIPIRDASVPSRTVMRQILDTIDETVVREVPLYLHCWGGHGRTGTVAACYLIRHGLSPADAIAAIERHRAGLPKSHFPFEGEQEAFIRSWTEDCS